MFKTINLLIVDDDEAIVKIFERVAKMNGWSHSVARSAESALQLIEKQVFECAVVDVKLPGFTGLQFLEHLKREGVSTEVVIMTGVGSVDTAVSAIKAGAYDYLTKPFDDISRVTVVLEKAMEKYRLVQKVKELQRGAGSQPVFEEIVGRSKKIQEVFNVIDSIAPTTSTVLIYGESGTGKELVARAIHFRSKRKERPFVVINCAAIPTQLLESELFGHKKGSFTGAIADKPGLLEEAGGGTLFRDEVSEIPQAVQVKLLRVLQEGEIRAVGDNDTKIVDVRLITATNQDLVKAVKEGRFREDLFYRINVIGIQLPPLRERPEDIPLLAYHFLKKYCAKMKKNVDRFSVDALQALQRYTWVGNVRELENVVERAVVLADGEVINAHELPPKVLGEAFYLEEEDSAQITNGDYRQAKKRAMESFNRAYITSLLRETEGNITFAADRAKMDRSNFKKLIKKYEINVDGFKR